ncbi:hypothetical protein PBY51_006184 [Eleginops maclovinus]|uniref:Uncharacterized protein n=1 Tax=Eleginops maclovinus TaxID=56733 RepID=A0AAN7WWA5_ELEMC|nr:hypothetical protein PBY51_006184 [Eleginops maclovinus]
MLGGRKRSKKSERKQKTRRHRQLSRPRKARLPLFKGAEIGLSSLRPPVDDSCLLSSDRAQRLTRTH